MDVLEKPKVNIQMQHSLLTQEEAQVTIHCMIVASEEDLAIRIWPTTFIRCNQTGTKIQLAHFENITLSPKWTLVSVNKKHCFTLLFKGLPKGCTSFDLIEEIPESGGFEHKNIKRNIADIYKVMI